MNLSDSSMISHSRGTDGSTRRSESAPSLSMPHVTFLSTKTEYSENSRCRTARKDRTGSL